MTHNIVKLFTHLIAKTSTVLYDKIHRKTHRNLANLWTNTSDYIMAFGARCSTPPIISPKSVHNFFNHPADKHRQTHPGT